MLYMETTSLFSTQLYFSKGIIVAVSIISYKYYKSALPGYLGKGITSLIFSRPVAKRIILSKPRPNPACFTVPYRLRSMYHSYGSTGKSISFSL
jgi:hypothetical protein